MLTLVAADSPAATPAALRHCPLLCLHPANNPNPLTGWRHARRLAAQVWLDGDGPCEALRLHAVPAAGRPGPTVLAATEAQLSALGNACARRIARGWA